MHTKFNTSIKYPHLVRLLYSTSRQTHHFAEPDHFTCPRQSNLRNSVRAKRMTTASETEVETNFRHEHAVHHTTSPAKSQLYIHNPASTGKMQHPPRTLGFHAFGQLLQSRLTRCADRQPRLEIDYQQTEKILARIDLTETAFTTNDKSNENQDQILLVPAEDVSAVTIF